MRRAIITGSRGFIGRRLVTRLRRDGWQVQRIDDSHTDVGQIFPDDWAGHPFTLIDLAWNTDRPAEYLPHAAHVNRLAIMLDQLPSRGLKAFIGVGTAEEYGQRDGLLSEDDAHCGRLSSYGWGKLAAGAMVRSWSETAGIPAYWLRPFLVYGPGQKGNMVIPYALRQALGGEPASFSDGMQERDFVFVDDVADALAAAAVAPARGFEILNAGSGVATPVREVLTEIAEQLGARDRFRFGDIPRRSAEPAMQAANTQKARDLLGWRAKIEWREGIRRVIESMRHGKEWAD
jgi:nucleoside-diphosphate-sugar epimerase